jgi:Tfp pilus assembly protein PilF
MIRVRAVVIAAGVTVLCGKARITQAQSTRPAPTPVTRIWLPLDTVLAPGERVGCESLPPIGTVTRDAAAARVGWREAQEALLEGDRARARARLEQVVAADPRDARAWLELTSTLETLGDSTAARTAACRVLTAPTATAAQRDEGERRWQRLLTPDMTQRLALATRRHGEGIRYAQRGLWRPARAAFDDVVRALPSAAGAWRNRAVVTAEAGDRPAAERDLERYLQMGAPAADRLALARALSALRRPRFSTGTALVSGLLPGGAQFYTQRRALGVLVLSAAAGAGTLAVLPRTEERTVPYLDPNGQPAPYVEQYKTYPYRTAGIATAAAILVAAAVEGTSYAARSAALPVFVASARGGLAGTSSPALQVGLQLRW